ncbi:MAG: hypothetical protein H2066_03975 [Candidatus Poseidoniales archaeon]|nr:hypothetical protein [Candidatus Poseidoniales archaeon]
MEFAYYSLSVILAYSFTRWVTENIKFHLRNNRFWLHHWILSALAMIVLLYFRIDSPFIWGALTGVALEGLGRKNWSILRNKS